MEIPLLPPAIESLALHDLYTTTDVPGLLRASPDEQRVRVDSWSLLRVLGLARDCAAGAELAGAVVSEWFTRALEELGPAERIRDAMRESGAVLSGSRCVRFLDRFATFPAGDWDFFTTVEASASFCSFVTTGLGGIEREEVGTGDGDEQLVQALGLRGRRVFDTPVGTVVVMSSVGSPAVAVTRFHSTIVMNYATADGFCIAHPVTFFKRVNLEYRSEAAAREGIKKYADRGYITLPSPDTLFPGRPVPQLCLPWGLCTRHLRALGDKFCLAVKLQAGARSPVYIMGFPRPLPSSLLNPPRPQAFTILVNARDVAQVPWCTRFVFTGFPDL
ncbi:hypothetical protein PsYK624_129480 [Phanerochaete sordida]|uniref:Uncharacterized protein n=1 Tax=Phanerochaete sordida TaxID=48140 RepID=A0A9P3GJM8_9APHY|nr:hypothetical protein PsYK624_129480 [Phanerochaete sordida]